MIGGTVGEGAGQAGVLAEAEPPLLGEGHKQGGRPAARSARAFYPTKCRNLEQPKEMFL